MASYINEAEALTQLKETTEQTTNDYKIFIRDRLHKSAQTKEVSISIVVKPQDAEPIFNKIAALKNSVCSDKILSLTSNIYLDEAQRILKDLIIVKTKVKTWI